LPPAGALDAARPAVLWIAVQPHAGTTAVHLHGGAALIRARALSASFARPAASTAVTAVEEVGQHVDAFSAAQHLPGIAGTAAVGTDLPDRTAGAALSAVVRIAGRVDTRAAALGQPCRAIGLTAARAANLVVSAG